LIPFYFYYPALICEDAKGIKFECDRHRVCQPDIVRYEYDYESEHTLINFMTQLDLVCIEPYYIGLIGTISFVSFATGSILFTKHADIIGRHKFVCYAAGLTPLAIAAMIIGSRKLGIFFLYFVFGILGLSYTPRASTVYLYGAEMLPVRARLAFGTFLFLIDGCFSIFAPVYFYYWKN